MNNALNKLLVTLQSNKNSSYFSLNSAWQFLTTFMKNYMWTELAKLPGLGSAVEALEKTLNDTSKEMYKLHTSIERKMSETVENEIKGLQGKSAFNFLSYDHQGGVTSDKSETLSIDHSA